MATFDSQPPGFDDAGLALDRLIGHAQGDHGGARRVVDFLLAWWNGPDLGHFPIIHLTYVDREIARDMVFVMNFLAQGEVWYADAWRRRDAIEQLIDDWRDLAE